MQRLFSIFIFVLLSFQGAAQPFAVRNFSVADGLPSSEVYDVFQDSRGFVWFSTDNGVVRFDGDEMTVFGTSDGLDDPVVFGIQEDHRGRIWFRTFSGNLFFYEHGKINPYPHNSTLAKACSRGLLISMYVDRKDRVWFSARDIWGHINAGGVMFADTIPTGHVVYKSIEGGQLVGYFTIAAKVWFSAVDVNGRSFPVSVTGEHRAANCFAVQWRNKLYLTVNNKIFAFDGTKLQDAYVGKGPITCLYKDGDDHLWIGYHDRGLERFDNPDFKRPWSLDFLSSRSVTNILQDTERGLWFTTLENGVFYLPNTDIELLSHTDSSKIRSVISDERQVISGAYNGMLTARSSRSRQVFFKRKFGFPVIALFKDSRKRLWVSTMPLTVLDHNLRQENQIDTSNLIIDFVEDNRGKIRAFGSANSYTFDLNGNLQTINHADRNGLRNTLFVDSIVYVASHLGLHVEDTAKNMLYKPASMAKFKISKLHSLDDSTLFVATIGNGFLLVDNRNWTTRQFDAKNQFIANNIYAAVKRDTTMWLGTEKGVLLIDLHSLKKNHLKFIQFDRSRGLVNDRVNFLAMTGEEAWAFSDQGISIIPYSTVKNKNRIPVFYFKKILINKKEIDASDYNEEGSEQNIILPHNETDISISFGYLSLQNQRVVTRYKLASGDPWIYTSDRSLHFSSLAPGPYRFTLEYSTDNFHWINATSSFTFRVSPPLWQRWYVQAGIFLVLAGLVYLYFRTHYRTIQKHQQKLIQAEIETLERERNRIAKELHDGVATNLSAIKLMVSQLLRTHNEPMAEDVDGHFMSAITEIKDIIYGLTPPGLERYGLYSGLRNYIDKLNKTIPIKIHLTATGNDVKNSELGIIVFRIIQELLSNAIRHSSAGHISIHLNATDNNLSLQFCDDGVGFSFNDGKSGLGLANIESRVEAANGKLKFESSDAGVPGSFYTINIPLN